MLSRNYPPCDALTRHIARYYIFSATLPCDMILIDRLLSETTFVRLLLAGEWAAEIEPDNWRTAGQVVLFGPNAHPLRVRVCGSFHLVGIAFRPGGWLELFSTPLSNYADRMLPFDVLWGDTKTLLDAVIGSSDDAAVIQTLDRQLINHLERQPMTRPNRAMADFEQISRDNSTVKVEALAERLGLTGRQLERRSLEAFGHSPKLVLRRSRFLDMAAVMRGFGNADDEALAALRYFDDAHRSREFRRFIGMTPGQFVRTPTPLLTAGLKLRAERKAEWVSSGPEAHLGKACISQQDTLGAVD